MVKEQRFRNTSVAVIKDDKGRILICRSPRHDNEWKFPQGGIDDGEIAREAIKREIMEELNIEIREEEIISQGKQLVSYFFPNGFEIRLHPFLIEFKEKKDIKLSPDEFDKMIWTKPEEIFNLNLAIRRDAYKEILQIFNLLS